MTLVLTKRVELDKRWLLGVIRLLYKKEPATSLCNWRPICLLQMVYKLTAAILHDRLRSLVETHNILEGSQEGFRGGKGVGRQGQSVTWIYHRAKRRKRKLFVAYVDFTLAFDSVDHEALFRAMEAFNIPDVDLIRSIYRATPYCVSTEFGDTAEIRVTRGCRQGCILSPLIFDIFMQA